MDGNDRLDRELKVLELKSLLEFYINRSLRYGQLNPDKAHEYKVFLSKLSEGYTIRFKRLGVIFNFMQAERQKKDFYGDTVIYTMGNPVIEQILDENSNLKTQVLEAQDNEFVNFFEPTFVPVEQTNPVQEPPIKPITVVTPTDNSDYEIIVPKKVDNTQPESAESEGNNHNDSVVFDKPKEEIVQPETPPVVTPEAEEQPSENDPTKVEKPSEDVPGTDTPVEDRPSQPSLTMKSLFRRLIQTTKSL